MADAPVRLFVVGHTVLTPSHLPSATNKRTPETRRCEEQSTREGEDLSRPCCLQFDELLLYSVSLISEKRRWSYISHNKRKPNQRTQTHHEVGEGRDHPPIQIREGCRHSVQPIRWQSQIGQGASAAGSGHEVQQGQPELKNREANSGDGRRTLCDLPVR